MSGTQEPDRELIHDAREVALESIRPAAIALAIGIFQGPKWSATSEGMIHLQYGSQADVMLPLVSVPNLLGGLPEHIRANLKKLEDIFLLMKADAEQRLETQDDPTKTTLRVVLWPESKFQSYSSQPIRRSLWTAQGASAAVAIQIHFTRLNLGSLNFLHASDIQKSLRCKVK